MLSSIKQSGGVQNSSTQIEEHKAQLWNEFEKFKDLSTKEVQRLRRQETDIQDALSSVKMELHSQRPDSATIETNNNLTMTSNFSMHSVDVEELRQQLAQTSIDLEEHKAQFKKNYSKNHKELETTYEEIDLQTNEEKKLRVKINQLENDLEHQLKRLEIICKSKGLKRP